MGDNPRYAMAGIGDIEERGYLHQPHPESWTASPPSRNHSPHLALRGRDSRSLYVREELLVTLVARLSPSLPLPPAHLPHHVRFRIL